MTRPALTVLAATIGLAVALLVYRLGDWHSDLCEAADPLARVAIVVGGIITWSLIDRRRRDVRLARDIRLVRETVGRQPPGERSS